MIKPERKEVLIGAAIICGTFLLGYKAGSHDAEVQITKGIQILWNGTPGLQDAMISGMSTAFKNRGVKK